MQADLEGAGCTGVADCHGMDGVPMVVRSGPANDEEWLFNYDEVKRRGGSADSSLLLTKPLGLGGHPTSLTAGSPMLVRWRAWINAGSPYLEE